MLKQNSTTSNPQETILICNLYIFPHSPFPFWNLHFSSSWKSMSKLSFMISKTQETVLTYFKPILFPLSSPSYLNFLGTCESVSKVKSAASKPKKLCPSCNSTFCLLQAVPLRLIFYDNCKPMSKTNSTTSKIQKRFVYLESIHFFLFPLGQGSSVLMVLENKYWNWIPLPPKRKKCYPSSISIHFSYSHPPSCFNFLVSLEVMSK